MRVDENLNVVATEPLDPVVLPEPGGLPAPALPYDTLYDRVETITLLILDGSLLPEDGLLLAVSETDTVLEAERLRREAEGRKIRRRYSAGARERAVALVRGGASYRLAAASVLGDERLAMTVLRWARKKVEAAT